MFSLMSLILVLAGADVTPHAKLPAKPQSGVVLWEGLGSHRHPVGTSSAEAQRFFDQGLTLIYAFNHDEAVRSFRRAGELDPKLAMAWWGVALALGPNYNMKEVDPEQAKAAYEALQKANQLAEAAPEPDRDFVRALAARFSADPKADGKQLLKDYAAAMGRLAAKYPDDLDAATLAAEAGMNLRPWKLWTADGKPEEGTEEIVRVLESVLRRNPDHPGGNHYYIHAVEASRQPERALGCAMRLPNIAPAAGHLVHMPAHIYSRIGDFAAAARSNEEAIEADRAYLQASGAKGAYPMMYFSHNIHFLAYARAMQGRIDDARKAAEELVVHVAPHVKDMPPLEGFLPTTTTILVRFKRWDDVLAAPKPDAKLLATTALWHHARGLAHSAKGRPDDAEKEQTAFRAVRDAIPSEAMYSDWNTARSVLDVADNVLVARMAAGRKDSTTAIAHLRKAVAAQDALNYGEPPDWMFSVRESLGAALLQNGDAAAAEQVFRDDLERNRCSARSLFGLAASLKAQQKGHAARLVQLEFERIWANADPRALRLEDF